MTRTELARAKEIEKLLIKYEQLLDSIHRPKYKLLLGYQDSDFNDWLCDDDMVSDIINHISTTLKKRISELEEEIDEI